MLGLQLNLIKGPYADLTLSVEKLLGLPKRSGKYFYVRMWARPKDVLRPSYDKEINDSVAELEFLIVLTVNTLNGSPAI